MSMIEYDKLCVLVVHFGVDFAPTLRNLACSRARYMSALESSVRLNRETTAGIAERVRRSGEEGITSVDGCELGWWLVGLTLTPDGAEDSEVDVTILEFDGSYPAYNLSSSSLAFGMIAPSSIRASRYSEARYAGSSNVFNSRRMVHALEKQQTSIM